MEPSSLPALPLALPESAVLARLALSDNGFVFDPVSGDTFTLNMTGLAILRLFLHHRKLEEVVEEIMLAFQVDRQEAERDIQEFATQLAGSLKP